MRNLLLALVFTTGLSAATFPDAAADQKPAAAPSKEIAVFAGGCFWGVAGVFERVKGVTDVLSGYAGGNKATAHYEVVSTGQTGHAESVKVTYDPSQITYGQLLKVFFAVAHDPTSLNFQGPDHGTQYRSAIFFTTPEQKRIAEAYVAQLNGAKTFPKQIVTQITPLKEFYNAEDYHQGFLDKNPNYPYIVYNDMPKIKALKSQLPQLCKK